MRARPRRVIPDAPHEVLLVLDATTGQNGLEQARKFTETCGVTGIVLTKLDGTAKGGVVVAIARELNLPIRYVGVGEKVDDLLPFDPEKFVASLFDNDAHDYMREALDLARQGLGAGQSESDGGRGAGARWRGGRPRLPHLRGSEARGDSWRSKKPANGRAARPSTSSWSRARTRGARRPARTR